MHGKQDSSGKQISFFQPLFDRELNGESEYRIPIIQNPFLTELWSKYREGPKKPKKTCFQKLDSSFGSRRFQASRQSFPDSALKTASSHMTSIAVGQKMDFYENPKPRGLKLGNLFLQIYHRFQERCQPPNSHIVRFARGSSSNLCASFLEILFRS